MAIVVITHQKKVIIYAASHCLDRTSLEWSRSINWSNLCELLDGLTITQGNVS